MSTENKKLSTDELNRLTPEEFQKSPKLPVVIVLDNIRSANNVGSIFRSADSFGISSVVLCGITAKPPHRDIQKTALGATETVEWKYHKSAEEAVKELSSLGYMVLSVEQTKNSQKLSELNLETDRPVALVLGNEVRGVQQGVIDLCDGSLEIEQFGTKHSLNVSVCAGVVMYEISKKLRVG
ncbi:RNA methyltransferase [Halocola ammonii]